MSDVGAIPGVDCERVELAGGRAVLWRGDCLRLLPRLDLAADAMITDPPYSSGGLFRGDRQQSCVSKYVQGGYEHVVHNTEFCGDTRDSRGWSLWVVLWMSAALDKLRDGGYVMSFTDWRQLPALCDSIQAAGAVWRGVVVWDKTSSSRAPHKGYFRHQSEYVVWGSKGRLAAATHGGPWDGVIRERVNHREKFHLAGKPVATMQRLVECVEPGGVVLDPFMGSGSTGVAALQSGRRFVGVEIEQRHFDTACRRIEALGL